MKTKVDSAKELKSKLADKEKERVVLQAALSKEQKEVRSLSRATAEAEKALSMATAEAVSVGWSEKREVRKREQSVTEIKGRLAEARKPAEAKQASLDILTDEIGELQAALAGPRALATRKLAVELASRLRGLQEEALQKAKELVAVYWVTEAATPQQIISRRSTRFVQVEILDPAMLERMFPDPIGRPASVVTHREYFKALEGVKKNRWQIVPGQDTTLREEEVEILKGPGPLPLEVERIADISLGSLFRPNGKPPSDIEQMDLTFNSISRLVSEADVAAAAQAIEGEV